MGFIARSAVRRTVRRMVDEPLYVSVELARILLARMGGQQGVAPRTVRFVTREEPDAATESAAG